MQSKTSAKAEHRIFVEGFSMKQKVVRNKNSGRSFWVRGCVDGYVELVPIQGEDVLVPIKDFHSEAWEIIH